MTTFDVTEIVRTMIDSHITRLVIWLHDSIL